MHLRVAVDLARRARSGSARASTWRGRARCACRTSRPSASAAAAAGSRSGSPGWRGGRRSRPARRLGWLDDVVVHEHESRRRAGARCSRASPSRGCRRRARGGPARAGVAEVGAEEAGAAGHDGGGHPAQSYSRGGRSPILTNSARGPGRVAASDRAGRTSRRAARCGRASAHTVQSWFRRPCRPVRVRLRRARAPGETCPAAYTPFRPAASGTTGTIHVRYCGESTFAKMVNAHDRARPRRSRAARRCRARASKRHHDERDEADRERAIVRACRPRPAAAPPRSIEPGLAGDPVRVVDADLSSSRAGATRPALSISRWRFACVHRLKPTPPGASAKNGRTSTAAATTNGDCRADAVAHAAGCERARRPPGRSSSPSRRPSSAPVIRSRARSTATSASDGQRAPRAGRSGSGTPAPSAPARARSARSRSCESRSRWSIHAAHDDEADPARASSAA